MFPKTKDIIITEPLNLYQKPASIRPEVNDTWQKPFGGSVKNQTRMGSTYKHFGSPVKTIKEEGRFLNTPQVNDIKKMTRD
jgi:hypothetical protein